MRSAPGEVRIESMPDAAIVELTDAVVRVVQAALCGTDLWGYRGDGNHIPPGPRAGHEFIGVVEETGREVGAVRAGTLVLAPFRWSDGTCHACVSGLPSSCPNGGMWGGDHDGGQGEAVRVPHADHTLVALPLDTEDERLPAVLTLADVMATGQHAVNRARVRPGARVAVVGDGAVGLCAALAARHAGAEHVTLPGRHDRRLALGARFGADTTLNRQDAAAFAQLKEQRITVVLECAGTQPAVDAAVELVADGGTVVLAGAPHARLPEATQVLLRNLTITGALAPARADPAPARRRADRPPGSVRGVRPHRRPRRGASRLPAHGRPIRAQGTGPDLIHRPPARRAAGAAQSGPPRHRRPCPDQPPRGAP
ncbi:zinc-binding dehydrogenase [Spirillospora sp. NPDC048911]|uniref:zinc-binding dehydrogenase n=1 Tax=Spirillospora sp. NPDC048911 TaxID=3364527 RepID=UPI00371EA758